MLKECNCKNDIDEIVSLVYELNNKPESSCGSCPKEIQKIKNKLLNLIKSTDNLVLLYYQDNNLVGVVGFDIDVDEKCGDCVGPFIKENYMDIAKQFIQYACKTLNGFRIYFYFDSRNQEQLCLMKMVNGIDICSDKRMVLRSTNNTDLTNTKIAFLTDRYKQEFCHMHDRLFSDVYWDSKKILKEFNNWTIYIETHEDELVGFLVVHKSDTKSYIQAVGVSENHRRKGYGKRLLNQAISDGFLNKNITSIELDVESDNITAERLYLEKGFQVQYESKLFEIKFTLLQ
ncbi:MAG: hypothetical protein K0R09_1404 [Clostridiales bacterium]|jgi:ribosomal protein S18 acetylase RimI-like enzyme|nr:hypothetical protein [Clostridiales bacterium]